MNTLPSSDFSSSVTVTHREKWGWLGLPRHQLQHPSPTGSCRRGFEAGTADGPARVPQAGEFARTGVATRSSPRRGAHEPASYRRGFRDASTPHGGILAVYGGEEVNTTHTGGCNSFTHQSLLSAETDSFRLNSRFEFSRTYSHQYQKTSITRPRGGRRWTPETSRRRRPRTYSRRRPCGRFPPWHYPPRCHLPNRRLWSQVLRRLSPG